MRRGLPAVLVMLLLPLAALAHHSLAGQFDVGKSVHITGKVAKVDWANPHVYVHVEVREAGGEAVMWKLETLPVAMMRKAGLTKQQLMAEGETVEIDAYPARNGNPHLGYMIHLKFADGRYVQFNKVPGAEQPGGQ